ncbi:PkB-like protein, partial [Phakopsora pachyrhizi]
MDDSDSLLNRSDSSSITTSTITASPPNLSSLHNSPNSNLSKSSTSTIQERPRKGIKDFKVGEVLGEGSYSTVYLAKDRSPPHRAYALKVLDKRHIQKEKKVKYVSVERDTLNILDHFPGCLRLYATFQDETSLYYLLEYAEQGEILRVIKYLGSLSNECARYYGAQILSAIEYMHSKGIIHRDIKPENILLDSKMKVKIADFGSAKILTPEKETQDVKSDGRSHSFVGTAEYVSPELLINKVTTKSSDLWAFGCVLFQMISGKPPFKSRSEYLTFQKITQLDYQFPDNFPTEARDLISKLLVIVPSERLSIEEIKRHKFFDGIDWGSVWDAEAPSLR